MKKRLEIIAADFVSLYREAQKQELLTSRGLQLDAFQKLFDSLQIEYLHYAGSSAAEPFHREVVEDLLQLASAYMTLQPDVAPKSRAFGLYLTFMLYATQPEIQTTPVKIKISVATLKNYLRDMEWKETCTDLEAAPHLGRRVTAGEKSVLLALHQSRAWQLMPFVNESCHVRSLLEVHEKEGIPLLLPSVSRGNWLNRRAGEVHNGASNASADSCPTSTLSRELAAYESMKQRLGLQQALAEY
ncbi:putative Small nuclear RNA activating complex (SNAPc) subunit SNAP43 [Trypanosoma vivax]|uniref:Small nuclear RNA activating protein 3 n=1 Tax=Trypanosoma vivax (strain Y486) TaxID=1055687 RepID=G0U746_TRYVY|nr:hypothetical protein TRVL_05624 [Trypanosoma vivax]KAH8611927.1 putative Small nuclear RNA activating complex (SNAPc) subunit SNAP43 [Trypanosoma vivax]CCC51703.1 conserved hypothetical protein [Trypanosoma vivax Y486]